MKLKICSLLFVSFFNYKLQAAEAMSISVVQDQHTFIDTQSHDIEIGTARVKRLDKLPKEKYSDHELMLIQAKNYAVISYNIGELFELKWGSSSGNTWYYINNGFMITVESQKKYKERLERLVERIARASVLYNSKIICLQEAMASEHLSYLLAKNLAGFNSYHEGPTIILVDKKLQSSFIALEASKKRKIMAVYMHEYNTVVVNLHAAWAKKQSEVEKKAHTSPIIADLNKALAELAQKYDNKNIEIYGDFNREDYELVDEYRTVDIRTFAQYLDLKHTQVFTPGTYTNIRYIDPHLSSDYSESLPGVLTTSDYFIQGVLEKHE